MNEREIDEALSTFVIARERDLANEEIAFLRLIDGAHTLPVD